MKPASAPSTCVRLLAFASALALVACPKSDKPLVQRTEIDVFEGREVVRWEAPQLVARLESALGRAGFSLLGDRPIPNGVKPWRISIAARIDEPDPAEELPGSATVVLSLRQKGSADSFDVDASEQTAADSNSVEDVQAASVKALDLSLAEAAHEARATIDLQAQPDEPLVKALSSSEAPVRSAALRLLARRRHSAALPALLERLKEEDLSVLRRTIGLLVELKDQKAVPAIIEASRGRNLVVQREVVFAIAAIGGDEAEAYLDVVATGHDDPLVRSSAEKALSELKSHKPAPKELPK